MHLGKQYTSEGCKLTPKFYSIEVNIKLKDLSAIIIERHVSFRNKDDGLGLRRINQLNTENYIKIRKHLLVG